jgi:hypothetical protein
MYILKRNYTGGESEILYTLTDLEHGEGLVKQLNSLVSTDNEWFTLHSIGACPTLGKDDKLRMAFEYGDDGIWQLYDFTDHLPEESVGRYASNGLFIGEGYSVEECSANAKATARAYSNGDINYDE